MNLIRPRRTWYVDHYRGYSGRTGKSAGRAFDTVQAAVDAADPGDIIRIAGAAKAYSTTAVDGYNEQVTIGADKPGLRLIGEGGRGAIFIAPTAANATGLIVNADDVELENVGCAGTGTGSGLKVVGSRFRAKACKIEGGAAALHLVGGLQYLGAAVGSADQLFDDCEICWATDGVKLSQGFKGAVTQCRIRSTRFHNITTQHVKDGDGVAAGLFRNLLVDYCAFEQMEDATDPTKYFNIAGSNANTGQVTRCTFPVALNSGKNAVSTAVKWLANYHPAGLSTGQPS